MIDPVFLDVEDVLLIHDEQLARYGGAAGIRGPALLESAIAMPRATAGGGFAHEDLFGISDPAESLYNAMIAVAEHRLDKAGLANVLRALKR